MTNTIKNAPPEKKAQRDFYEEIEDFEMRPSTPIKRTLTVNKKNFRRTSTSSWHGGGSSVKRCDSRESRAKADPMRESTMSFFKEVFAKSTAPTEETESLAAFYLGKKSRHESHNPSSAQKEKEPEGPLNILQRRRMSAK